jgi:serine/threonine protein kinase
LGFPDILTQFSSLNPIFL